MPGRTFPFLTLCLPEPPSILPTILNAIMFTSLPVSAGLSDAELKETAYEVLLLGLLQSG